MFASPESLVVSSEYQNLPQTEETSRFQEIINGTKRFIGRCALVLSIASGCTVASTAAEATFDPSPAEAAVSFVNNYPDMDAELYNASTYDWWKDENHNGQADVTPSPTDDDETISPRGNGYRNCTDGASFWAGEYVNVQPRAWGNAKDWHNKASSLGYTVLAGDSSNIEPGDIAEDESGNYGHVGFVTKVTKDSSGNVISVEVAELNRDGKGNYSLVTYASKNPAGNFVRNGSGADWDHFIDLNGLGKGLSDSPLPSSGEGTPPASGPTFSPAIVQRPSGETDIAVVGPGNALHFYMNSQGSLRWDMMPVAGAFVNSTPVMVQRSSGETDIIVQGRNNSLDYYYNFYGNGTWGVSHIAVENWAYSVPAVVQRPNGETDVVVVGPDHTLDFYMNDLGSSLWKMMRIAGPGSAYSTPAIVQRPSGETDIAVMGPNNSLKLYMNDAGYPTWGHIPVAVNGWVS